MKNFASSLILFLTFHAAFGQQCNKKIDSFSNEEITTFEWKRGGIRNLYFESTKGTIIFEFRGTEMGAVEQTIPKGAEVLIKLENNEIIKLTSLNDARSAVQSITLSDSDNMTFSQYYLRMEITPEHLQKLAKFRLTDLRYPDLHGSSRSLDDEQLGNKWQRLVMDGAKCILNGK